MKTTASSPIHTHMDTSRQISVMLISFHTCFTRKLETPLGITLLCVTNSNFRALSSFHTHTHKWTFFTAHTQVNFFFTSIRRTGNKIRKNMYLTHWKVGVHEHQPIFHTCSQAHNSNTYYHFPSRHCAHKQKILQVHFYTIQAENLENKLKDHPGPSSLPSPHMYTCKQMEISKVLLLFLVTCIS